MTNIINLNEFADGGLAEQLNREIGRVLENIADPNTDATKKRKVVVTITMVGDERRDVVLTDILTKTTLTPPKSLGTKIVMGHGKDGKVTGKELKSGIPGQTYITEEGRLADDKGQIIDEETGEIVHEEGVIDLRKKRNSK